MEVTKGDTWFLPVINIGAANFSSASLLGSTFRLQVRNGNKEVVLSSTLSNTTISVENKSISYPVTNEETGVTTTVTTPIMWWLIIAIVFSKEDMEIPPGGYALDYEVTYPNGVRKTYHKTKFKVLQDVTHA